MPLFQKRIKQRDLGKPTPDEKPSTVPFGELSAPGVRYIPEDLIDSNADVTETANTGANTDENWIKITNGANTARFFKKGETKLIVDLETSVPAQITSGELVFVLEDPNATGSRQLHRMDLNAFPPLADQRSALFKKAWPFNMALAPNYKLFLKVKSSSTLATANSKLSIEGITKANNVTLEDFKKDYARWLDV